MSDRQVHPQIEAQLHAIMNNIDSIVKFMCPNLEGTPVIDLVYSGDHGIDVSNLPGYAELEENIILLNDFRNRDSRIIPMQPMNPFQGGKKRRARRSRKTYKK
jgi:hypothetical protein